MQLNEPSQDDPKTGLISPHSLKLARNVPQEEYDEGKERERTEHSLLHRGAGGFHFSVLGRQIMPPKPIC